MASSLPEEEHPREQYNCPVCLENVRWRLPVATMCGHVFCGHCMETALENFCQKCPVCNQVLDEPTFSISLLNSRPGTHISAMRRCSYRSQPVEVYDDPNYGRWKNGIIKNTADVTDHTHYECPKCAEPVITCDPVSTECGHVFCGKCLETIAKCPICESDVAKDKLVRIYL